MARTLSARGCGVTRPAAQRQRGAVTNVLSSFLIKTFPRFPIRLLHVSKYVRTPPLVKSGLREDLKARSASIFRCFGAKAALPAPDP